MKKLISTILVGKYQQLTPLTRPLIERYAKKCRADFYCMTESKNPDYPLFDKLELTKLDYDRMLIIDGDALVRNDCPNLFNIVKKGMFAGYDEGSQLPNVMDVMERLNAIDQLITA